jgi:outer membrane protein assembly factor BamA
MPRGRIFPPALSLITLILLFGIQASAQSRDPCSPAYTNSDEFKEMTGKKVFPKIIADDVQIVGATQIPVSVIQDVTAKARGREFDGGEDWLNEIQDSQVRDAWQDRGFFKVLTTAEPTLLFGDATTQHYAVIIHVEEGEQFYLGKVGLRSSDPDVPLVFPDRQLREMLPMNEGDVFAASKVREGLDNMHKA